MPHSSTIINQWLFLPHNKLIWKSYFENIRFKISRSYPRVKPRKVTGCMRNAPSTDTTLTYLHRAHAINGVSLKQNPRVSTWQGEIPPRRWFKKKNCHIFLSSSAMYETQASLLTTKYFTCPAAIKWTYSHGQDVIIFLNRKFSYNMHKDFMLKIYTVCVSESKCCINYQRTYNITQNTY